MISKLSIREYISDRIIRRSDDFLYILPDILLRPHISHYTITFPSVNTISEDYTVIPNGGSTLVYTYDGRDIGTSFFGATTKMNKVGREANRSDLLLIISFRPCGAAQFLKIDQHETADLLLPFDIVDLNLYKVIKEAFERSKSVFELVTKLDSIFLSYINNDLTDKFILGLRDTICRGNLMSIEELSKYTHYSKRHLGRIFGQYSGINIKTYMRLARINKAIKLIQKTPGSITQAAISSGFYDQSHFIHEFKSFCGTTPGDYLKKMSDYYNEI
jgi:AraC-like DNA-binding protein